MRCTQILVALMGLVWLSAAVYGQDGLEKAFQAPPASARPHTWWHWMNGNVTREGITADLEAMARVGVGGAQIFNAGCGIPVGPVEFGSPEWLAMIKHAASEARRLGIELCIHNCAGWSSSGGPWNTPEHGMKIVVTSEVNVTGPKAFAGDLAQPPMKLDWYRDIAVLAFPTPKPELARMADASPTVTISSKTQDPKSLIDGRADTSVHLHRPSSSRPATIQFSFPEPFAARALTLTPRGSMRPCHGRLEVSDDGKTFKELAKISIPKGSRRYVLSFEPVTAKVYRVSFLSADRRMRRLVFSEAELSRRVEVGNLEGKTFLIRGGAMSPVDGTVGPGDVIARSSIVDLTGRMAEDGKLSWDVPEGSWTILRVGYTPNGRGNHPACEGGSGLECDKLSKEAAQAHWDGMMGRILTELGPLAGDVKSGLNNVLIDSYEVGTQNWTQGFAKEFQRRCGYDLTPFLPTFTGRVVDNPEVTERFLWDLRRTVADMFAENYSGAFREMAHKAGLLYSVEAYGNSPSDNLQYGSYADIPMGEFWPGSGASPGNAKLAAAMGHVNGNKYIGAESFTAAPAAGKWLKDPYSLKAQGDAVFCGGINRIIYHRYAHQPWMNRFPGMTMGQWGTHFERTLTWWEQGRDWLTYQARCQYLLQEGRFVADVCFYCGESAPNSLRTETLPYGYDYDGCATGALLSMTVRDGRVVLPSGMSYRLLVLPSDKTMTPRVLRKIKVLVDAGATVVGRGKPEASPSLAGYPGCDAEVKSLAATLWPNGVKDQSVPDALKAIALEPDFSCDAGQSSLAYIHRVIDGSDVYFVASHSGASAEFDCTFRVQNRLPELWHPDTGKTEVAPIWRVDGKRTTVRLRFDAAGSVFVVFRRAPEGVPHAVAVRCKVEEDTAKAPVYELKILKAEYGAFAKAAMPDCVDVTEVVKGMLAKGVRVIPASNSLAGDPAPNVPKELKLTYRLNGAEKTVRANESKTVTIPAGAEMTEAVYGLIDEEALKSVASSTVDITEKLAARVERGTLRVKIDNVLAGKDPASMVVKEARVDYFYRGVEKHTTVGENQVLVLPEVTGRRAPVPDCRLQVAGSGGLELVAWKSGTYELDMPSGATVTKQVDAISAPVGLEGPWTLAFPPNWGAPAKVTLPELISWTEHSDDGVKYFSGTATYTKTFSWKEKKRGDARYVLDFGDLRNFAEATLNGKDLGILWKPPFRLDVTDVLRKGKNTLTVAVTNMWPNRLIGDEKLHEPDCEWKGLALKEWPKWLLEGKPSPTGRLTFTTWHHWTKDDAPLLSGLLGPVEIRTLKVVPVEAR